MNTRIALRAALVIAATLRRQPPDLADKVYAVQEQLSKRLPDGLPLDVIDDLWVASERTEGTPYTDCSRRRASLDVDGRSLFMAVRAPDGGWETGRYQPWVVKDRVSEQFERRALLRAEANALETVRTANPYTGTYEVATASGFMQVSL